MTVKELIEILQEQNPEDEVVIPTDPEMLYHETVMEIHKAIWLPDTQQVDWEIIDPGRGQMRCIILVPEH